MPERNSRPFDCPVAYRRRSILSIHWLRAPPSHFCVVPRAGKTCQAFLLLRRTRCRQRRDVAVSHHLANFADHRREDRATALGNPVDSIVHAAHPAAPAHMQSGAFFARVTAASQSRPGCTAPALAQPPMRIFKTTRYPQNVGVRVPRYHFAAPAPAAPLVLSARRRTTALFSYDWIR